MLRLGPNRYGKSEIRLVTVDRSDPHEVQDLTVDVNLSGDFEAAHTEGDNRLVVPTDTMRNTAYGLSRRMGIVQPEVFALALADHFLETHSPVTAVEISILQHPWARIEVEGHPHAHAFVREGQGTRTARVIATRRLREVEAGLEELSILKTTGSAFEEFALDHFTTLGPAEDRMLATVLSAWWRYTETDGDFGAVWESVRRLLLEEFARHDQSRSVQHTGFVMGCAVLEAHPGLSEIRLSLPNKHHHEVDLKPFGLDNPGVVFEATDRPYGLIEVTVTRTGDLPGSSGTTGS